MNATKLLLVLCVTAVPLLLAADAPHRPPERDLARENADLRAYVNALEEKVRTLQEEVSELRRQRPRVETRIVPVPPPATPRRPAPPARPAPPMNPRFDEMPAVPRAPWPEPDTDRRDWQERRFNGGRFYVIPLSPEALGPTGQR